MSSEISETNVSFIAVNIIQIKMTVKCVNEDLWRHETEFRELLISTREIKLIIQILCHVSKVSKINYAVINK